MARMARALKLAGPAAEALGREVAVRALDGGGAVLGELLEQRLRVLGRGVVGVVAPAIRTLLLGSWSTPAPY